jgi:hypothetical protein
MFSRCLSFVPVAVLTFASTSLAAQQAAATDCAKVRAAATDHADMNHEAHLKALAACANTGPAQRGQAAFAAVTEVVQLLKDDPNTDWSKVNIEALRQHLIDMDDVMMRTTIAQRPVSGGIDIDVSGTGRTVDAIRRVVINHAAMLDQSPEYHAVARETSNGAHLTVTAKNTGDTHLVAQIRGLGFAGLLTEGDHHAAHHLALARGDAHAHAR